MPPALSVVIPTLNESRSIAALLGDLRTLRAPHEIIVVDGGSTDETAAIAVALG
ncbi:MAG: glycosyltransferase, partial [Gemmatimonadota bacterium]|nr:glycosyltransferase [Gemmatimonadota bacterium]